MRPQPPIVNLASQGVLLAVALWWLFACGEVKGVGADFAELSYCEVETCGQVFLCTMPDDSKNEWCWQDDNADELASASGAVSCVPTPRGGALGWPCLWCTKGRGGNAYQGSFGCGAP